MTAAERPAAEVDHGREVDVHTGPSERTPGQVALLGRVLLTLVSARRARRRQTREGANVAALLVDEDERPARSRRVAVPTAHEHPADAGRSG